MAAETTPEQGYRITTGHVYREVDNLKGEMEKGFKAQTDLMKAHFQTVNVRLEALKDLPGEVEKLKQRVSLLEDDDSDRERRLTRLIALASVIVAILALFL